MFRDLLRTPGKSWMSRGGWKIISILWGLGSRKSSRVTSHTIETPTFLPLYESLRPTAASNQDKQTPPFRASHSTVPMASSSKHTPSPHAKKKTHTFHHLGPHGPFPLSSSPCYFFSESSTAPALSTGISWKVPLLLVFASFQWISPNDIQIYKLPVLQHAMDHAGIWVLLPSSIQSPSSPMTAWEVLHPTAGSLPARSFGRRPSPPLFRATSLIPQSQWIWVCGRGMWTKKICLGFCHQQWGSWALFNAKESPYDTPGSFCQLLNDMTLLLMTPPSPKKSTFPTYQLVCDTLSCVFHCFPLGSVPTHYSFLFVFIKMGTSDKHSYAKLSGPSLPYLSIDSFFWTLKHALEWMYSGLLGFYLLVGIYAAFY